MRAVLFAIEPAASVGQRNSGINCLDHGARAGADALDRQNFNLAHWRPHIAMEFRWQTRLPYILLTLLHCLHEALHLSDLRIEAADALVKRIECGVASTHISPSVYRFPPVFWPAQIMTNPGLHAECLRVATLFHQIAAERLQHLH